MQGNVRALECPPKECPPTEFKLFHPKDSRRVLMVLSRRVYQMMVDRVGWNQERDSWDV